MWVRVNVRDFYLVHDNVRDFYLENDGGTPPMLNIGRLLVKNTAYNVYIVKGVCLQVERVPSLSLSPFPSDYNHRLACTSYYFTGRIFLDFFPGKFYL